MTSSRIPDPVLIAAATLTGLVAAIGAFATLSALTTPAHLKSRIDTIEAGIERTRVAFAQPRGPSHYLAAPVCRANPSSAGDLVRTELSQAAKQSGLAAPTITLEASGQDLTSQTFPVIFTIDVTDRYDLVLGFLNRLAQSEPEVFADSLDLTSKTSAVSLKFTGRVECLSSS